MVGAGPQNRVNPRRLNDAISAWQASALMLLTGMRKGEASRLLGVIKRMESEGCDDVLIRQTVGEWLCDAGNAQEPVDITDADLLEAVDDGLFPQPKKVKERKRGTRSNR